MIRPRQYAINGIHQFEELQALAIARMRNGHRKIRVDVRGIAAEDDDAIRKNDGFLDVVCDDEHSARGDLVIEPELEEFAAQRFRRKHIERGKRLVHEEHLRLDNQSAGHAYALLHAPGKLLGISGLESVQPDGVENAQGSLVTLNRRDAASFERSFDVFNDRKPGKEREALEDDGDVRKSSVDRLAVPVNRAPRRGGKAREHAHQRGFPATRGPQQCDDLSGINRQINGRNDLDAAAVGLRIVLLQLTSLNDWLGRGVGGVSGDHARVYYRSTAGWAHTTAPSAKVRLRYRYCDMNAQ